MNGAPRNTEAFPSRVLINSGVAVNLTTILYIIQRLHPFLVKTSITFVTCIIVLMLSQLFITHV